jgi:hypothetical protein
MTLEFKELSSEELIESIEEAYQRLIKEEELENE